VFLDCGLVQHQNTATFRHQETAIDLPAIAAYFALNVKLTGAVSLPVTVTSWV
jgi:hypothetical protein